jgi:pimeloyl-ACP methyl ester carboxylesterase
MRHARHAGRPGARCIRDHRHLHEARTVLAKSHRVFAIELSGTGYSAPNPPFSADHLADQILALLTTAKLTGPNAPVLVGHSAGVADVGIAALQHRKAVRGVVFLDGDAAPLGDWLIRNLSNSLCGSTCPALDEAGVNTWRWPLEQPGFQAETTYSMRYGITAMTPAQFAALKATDVPKLVVTGVRDPDMPHSDAALTAQRIGAPPPVYVPGRHLTMIASPRQIAAAIDSLDNR